MSESGVNKLVRNEANRGWFAHLLWPVMAQRMLGLKKDFGAIRILDVVWMLEGRISWTQDLMNMADDRLELAKVRGS